MVDVPTLYTAANCRVELTSLQFNTFAHSHGLRMKLELWTARSQEGKFLVFLLSSYAPRRDAYLFSFRSVS